MGYPNISSKMKGVVAMPSIVGNIKILSVGPSSNVQIGDVAVIHLASSSKTYSGANSFNTGDTFGPNISNNQASSTNTNDPDVTDSTAVAGV
jgi:spore germination protein PA